MNLDRNDREFGDTMGKNLLLTLVSVIMLATLLSACNTTTGDTAEGTADNPLAEPNETGNEVQESNESQSGGVPLQDPEKHRITEKGSFSQEECERRGLDGKAIMIESRYCGHCQSTKPDFLAACNATAVQPVIVDIVENEGSQWLKDKALTIRGTPTFIFDCEYFVGVREKTGYIEKLSAMSS